MGKCQMQKQSKDISIVKDSECNKENCDLPKVVLEELDETKNKVLDQEIEDDIIVGDETDEELEEKKRKRRDAKPWRRRRSGKRRRAIRGRKIYDVALPLIRIW